MNTNQQSNLRTDTRLQPFNLTRSGDRPTLPTPLNLKIGEKNWRLTDLANGEYCINDADEFLFFRTKDKIHTIDLNNIGGGADTYKLKVTAVDTTPDFLNLKIVGGAGVTTSVLNPGTNEQIQIDFTESDPIFSAWLIATPPLFAETDPVFNAWLIATPPLYVEADPVFLAWLLLNPTSGTNSGDQVGDGVTITGTGTIIDPFVSVGGGAGGGTGSDLYLFYNY